MYRIRGRRALYPDSSPGTNGFSNVHARAPWSMLLWPCFQYKPSRRLDQNLTFRNIHAESELDGRIHVRGRIKMGLIQNKRPGLRGWSEREMGVKVCALEIILDSIVMSITSIVTERRFRNQRQSAIDFVDAIEASGSECARAVHELCDQILKHTALDWENLDSMVRIRHINSVLYRLI